MKYQYAVKYMPENGRQTEIMAKSKLTLKQAREHAEYLVRGRVASYAVIHKYRAFERIEREPAPLKVTKL